MSFKFNFFENNSDEAEEKIQKESEDVKRVFKDNGIKWVIQPSAYINFITASML